MHLLRLVLVAFALSCLPRPVFADATADSVAPFAMDKHYSADVSVATKEGMNIQSKTYVDGDKMRSDVNMGGMAMSIIVRKDTKKIYQVMDAQKMIMEMAYNPNKFPGNSAASFGPEGKFTPVGPDTVDGIACTKYIVTSDKTKQVFYFWLDTARQIPVQMAAVSGSFVVKWKNFAAGPQNPALFEPPTGYQVMQMPSMPGMPGAPTQ
jgi:hypothetical protein